MFLNNFELLPSLLAQNCSCPWSNQISSHLENKYIKDMEICQSKENLFWVIDTSEIGERVFTMREVKGWWENRGIGRLNRILELKWLRKVEWNAQIIHLVSRTFTTKLLMWFSFWPKDFALLRLSLFCSFPHGKFCKSISYLLLVQLSVFSNFGKF